MDLDVHAASHRIRLIMAGCDPVSVYFPGSSDMWEEQACKEMDALVRQRQDWATLAGAYLAMENLKLVEVPREQE